MSEENNEYEVERIIEARVEKKRKQLILKFCVRWKGYGSEDDTWEPIESFDGSEGIIEQFWERVNSGGRDFRDMSLFKPGEAFAPTGPPRRKRKRTNQDPTQSLSLSPEKPRQLSPTRRPEEHTEFLSAPDTRPTKRSREHNTGNGTSKLTPHTVESSTNLSGRTRWNGIEKTPPKLPKETASPPTHRSRRASRRLVTSPDTTPSPDDEVSTMLDGSLFGSPLEQANELPDDSPSPEKGRTSSEQPIIPSTSSPIVKKPLHRSSKPLIKLVDEPYSMENAISVKARLMGRSAPTSNGSELNEQGQETHIQPPRQKPGPGRSSMGLKKPTSSLLTFEKGALKTVKRRYVKDNSTKQNGSEPITGDTNDELVQGDTNSTTEPPKPDELLKLAGLGGQSAETLPSYEENIVPAADKTGVPSHEDAVTTPPQNHNKIFNDAKHNLLPTSPSTAVSESLSASWKHSTIFDPLIRGLDLNNVKDLSSPVPGSVPFWLNLDHSFSIPILLSSASPVAADSTSRRISRPGAFYKGDHALGICKMVHTSGTPGVVTMSGDAKEEDKGHFEQLCARLFDGELFIIPAGIEVLAFWSAKNVALTQSLNVQPSLDTHRHILFCKIIVDNYSGYSEFVTYADPVPWLQYMEKH